MNRELRRWKELARRSRSSVDEEAAAFRHEAGCLRVEIAHVRVEITETMTSLHAWSEAAQRETKEKR